MMSVEKIETTVFDPKQVISSTPQVIREWTELQNTNGNHNKFYKMKIVFDHINAQHIVKTQYGKIGLHGRTIQTGFNSGSAADVYIEDVIRKKLAKGYVRI